MPQTGLLSSKKISALVKPLSIGDFGYLSTLNDETGRTLDLQGDFISGKYRVFCFFSHQELAGIQEELVAFEHLLPEFEKLGAAIVLISSEADAGLNKDLKNRFLLHFPILLDPSGVFFAHYGLKRGEDIPGPKNLRTVLLNPNCRVQCILDSKLAATHAETLLERLHNLRTLETQALMPAHAPVLLIPGVFNAQECQDLIRFYDRVDSFEISKSSFAVEGKDFKFPVFDHDRQDRIDLVIKNPKVVEFLGQRLRQRVFPQIEKAFAFKPSKNEFFHIARYEGPRKGTQMGHRDNTAHETGYRKFAFSLNLNEEFEGGAINFREYSEQGYKGPPGTALIFSSSLLHEIEETVTGVRYSLITHLF